MEKGIIDGCLFLVLFGKFGGFSAFVTWVMIYFTDFTVK